VTPARLYCQGACAVCGGLTRLLGDGGVALEVHDVTTEPHAFEVVAALGYQSLPVLIGPGGSPAAGQDATTLARRLTGATRPAGRGVYPVRIEEEP